jgi:hypothetical protein
MKFEKFLYLEIPSSLYSLFCISFFPSYSFSIIAQTFTQSLEGARGWNVRGNKEISRLFSAS